MSISKELGFFVEDLKFKNLSPKTIEKAKMCFLDNIGTCVYGRKFEASNIFLNTVQSLEKGVSSVLGTDIKTSLLTAAFCNGIMSHVADYDDSCPVAIIHPSCVLVPTIISLGEYKKINGKQCILSYVVGYEVACKISARMGWEHYNKGWHTTGTIGCIAASVSASKLLNLNAKQVATAVGIAASNSSGLQQNFGTMTKSWHAGHAAMTGILSALAAEKGYTSSSKIFEGKNGFIKAFGGHGEDRKLIEKDYMLESIAFKIYPCCAGTHAGIEAILKIKHKYNLSLNDIKEVECNIRPTIVSILAYPQPSNELEAKFSMQYCMATAFKDDNLNLKHFTYKAVKNEETRKLMSKIKVVSDKAIDELAEKYNQLSPARVKVILNDGRKLLETVIEPKGGKENPISWEELSQKFIECSTSVLSLTQAEKILDSIKDMENIKDIGKKIVKWSIVSKKYCKYRKEGRC